MSSRTACWWQARLPGLVSGAVVGVLLGALHTAGWLYGWQCGRIGQQYARIPALDSLSTGELLLGGAIRLLGGTALCALMGLLSRPSSRVNAVYLGVTAFWQYLTATVRRAPRRRV